MVNMKATRYSLRSGIDLCPTHNGFRIDLNFGCPFCKQSKFKISLFDHLFRFHLNLQYLDKDICDSLKVGEDLMQNISNNKLITSKERKKLFDQFNQSVLPRDLSALYHCTECSLQVSNPQQLKSHITLFEHYPKYDSSIGSSTQSDTLPSDDDEEETLESESTYTSSEFENNTEGFSENGSTLPEVDGEIEGSVSQDSVDSLSFYEDIQKQTSKIVDEIIGTYKQTPNQNSHRVQMLIREKFLSRFERWDIPKGQNKKFTKDPNELVQWLDDEKTLSKTYGTINSRSKFKNHSQIDKMNLKEWNTPKCVNDKFKPISDQMVQWLDDEKTLSKQYIEILQNSTYQKRRNNQISLSPRRSQDASYQLRNKRKAQESKAKNIKKCIFNENKRNRDTTGKFSSLYSSGKRDKSYHFKNCCLKCFKKFRHQDKFSLHDKDYCIEREPPAPKCQIWDVQPDTQVSIRKKNTFLSYFNLVPIA